MTHDELKAAAARVRRLNAGESRPDVYSYRVVSLIEQYGEAFLPFDWYDSLEEIDRRALADYAAASLDETPIDRAWLVKLLGEPTTINEVCDVWGAAASKSAWIDRLNSEFFAVEPGVYQNYKRPIATRADALAFFKLVKWPVELGKILEAAKT